MVDCVICRSTKSDDEPTKPSLGKGVGSEGKTIRATRFIYLNALHCKPVNASKITTKIHSSDSLDEEPNTLVLPALVLMGKSACNKV